MAVDITITLNLVGEDQGPLFDLYSNVDDFSEPYETNISKSLLQLGYITSAPDGTSTVRVCGIGNKCDNCAEITPIYTTTTTTTKPGIGCGTVTESGGAGVTSYDIPLETLGGSVVIDFNANGVTDKLEILHNGIKVSTSGMVTPNEGPFDNIWGQPDVPNSTQTLSVDQFVGRNKGEVPSRQAELLAETGKNYTLRAQGQQFIWWNYTDQDVLLNPVVQVRITGPTGTVWDLVRRCDDDPDVVTTTTTTTIKPILTTLKKGALSTSVADRRSACEIPVVNVTTPIYVYEESEPPVISSGSVIYEDSLGTSVFNGDGNWYKMSFNDNPGTYFAFRVSSLGVVLSPIDICAF